MRQISRRLGLLNVPGMGYKDRTFNAVLQLAGKGAFELAPVGLWVTVGALE
jgi:hypothetical protein